MPIAISLKYTYVTSLFQSLNMIISAQISMAPNAFASGRIPIYGMHVSHISFVHMRCTYILGGQGSWKSLSTFRQGPLYFQLGISKKP